MPTHDWSCPCSICDGEILDKYQPRLEEAPPLCPVCSQGMERVWSLSNSGSVTFREFDMHMPGGKTRRITSLHELRQVEKASEGTKQPVAIRQYSNDKGRSGEAANVFGVPDQPKAHKDFQTRTKRGIPFRRMVGTK